MLCVLLIDDNPNDRLIATRELKKVFTDIEIRPIINIEELEKAIAAGGFDLAITDYQLCWSNGLKVLEAIKASYPSCPVVMFTDSGSEEVAVAGMKAGLSDYVLKGRQLHRLPIAVSESLEKQKLRQQYASTVEQLSISSERLKLALTAAGMGTWDWNLQTAEVVWSQDLERLFGMEAGSFDGSYKRILSYIHPDDRDLIAESFAVALEGKIDYDREFRVIWPNGSVHWIYAKGKFFYDTSGQATRMIGVMLDATERKQAEVERERLYQESLRANRVKDEFLATLSHELRSPLNAILGWASLLRSRSFDENITMRALETIERNSRLQKQLIEDLLDVSRIIRGKLSLNVCPVNLIVPIEGAIETMRLAAEAKSIQIQTLLSTVGKVSGDANRLQQVVWNLLSNAIKFTPTGGRVEIRLEQVGSYAQLQVRDTGKGITADFLPHVFDYFRQADASSTRVHGGLGLGLAIVRHLVELHGGTVSATSAGEEQGATFTVLLPLTNSQGIDEPKARSIDDSFDLSGVRVLVVDDEPDTREFVTFVLEQTGAISQAVASAAEARKVFEQFAPDLLVSDIGMPAEDGYSLIRKIRSLKPEPAGKIPAIALTAYAREDERIVALASGFQLHLSKPVEPNDLIAAVVKLAGRL